MLFEKNSSPSPLIKLVTGLVMVIAVLQTVHKLPLPAVNDIWTGFSEIGKSAAESGLTDSREKLCESIRQKTQAYILDKAEGLGADITVEVILSDDTPPYPISAILSGMASPYAREQLTHCLKTELNISEDNQRWI
jgi:stage III sporulation protein AF